MTDKHAGDSLKYQWRIVGAVLRSDWATGLDKSIAFEIVDNYRKDFRNSRASLGYLVKATGADRKSVIASTRRLVDNGPFRVVRQGAGTRPTEYAIDFDSVRDFASSGADATTNKTASSSGVDSTSRSGVESTTSATSSGVEATQSVLPVAAYKAGIQDRDNDPAAPALGLAASAAGAGDGFEDLWKAYGKAKAGSKKSARESYEKLRPDAETQLAMIEAAIAWRERWEAQDNPDAPRYTLAKWIEREEFECEPPGARPSKKNATTNDNVKAAPQNKPDFSIPPDETISATLERVLDEVCEDGARSLMVFYRAPDGREIEQFAIYEGPDAKEVGAHKAEVSGLLRALGAADVSDLAGKVGLTVDLVMTGGKLSSVNKPWSPGARGPRGVPKFRDVVRMTPTLGWSSKIGTAYADEEDDDVSKEVAS